MAGSDLIPESVYEGIGGPKAKAIAEFYLLHPKARTSEIAEHFKVSVQRVSTVLNSNIFFRALRMAAGHHLKRAVKQASETLVNCLDSTSEDVRLKSATKILENEGILGPERVDVTVNDVRNLPLSKLIEIAQMPIDPTIIEMAKREEGKVTPQPMEKDPQI